jgi:hypothetical protein
VDPSYLSPARYSQGGYGVTLPSSAMQLRNTLLRATTLVNTWCNGELLPSKFDFRGGSVEGEQHTWRVPAMIQHPGTRRVYLNQRPIREVIGFRIDFTNNYNIVLPPDNLFVNAQQGYIEIVASQPTIVGFPPIGYWFGLSEPISSTDYTYGWRFTATEDVCEAASPTLYYATRGNWLVGGDVTITVGGVEVDPADYTLDIAGGSILFETAPAPGQSVLATYVYTLPDAIADATGEIATWLIGQSRIAGRGMLGLQSIRVAEVTLTAMQGAGGIVTNKAGVTIPSTAATLLGPFALGSAA